MKITIRKGKTGYYTVRIGDRVAPMLGWDEMIGLITAATMPQPAPRLQWLKTPDHLRAT